MSAALVGSPLPGARLNRPSMPLPPRFEISKSSAPLPLLGSTGCRTKRSAEKCTLPSAALAACAEIDDRQVVPIRRVDRELDGAHQLFVRPRLAKRLPVGHGRSGRNGHLRDLGADPSRNGHHAGHERGRQPPSKEPHGTSSQRGRSMREAPIKHNLACLCTTTFDRRAAPSRITPESLWNPLTGIPLDIDISSARA